MAVSDMASFSDAHECAEIPIIAAALHRVILPAQSQIWAVLQASDSIRRINYSLINTFLGVMCLSGDVIHLSEEQWRKTEEGMAFDMRKDKAPKDLAEAFDLMYFFINPATLGSFISDNPNYFVTK